MIVTCPQCATRYRIVESEFPHDGRIVRCGKCGCSWVQQPDTVDQPTAGAVDAESAEELAPSANPLRPKGQRLAVFTALLGLAAVVALIVWGLLGNRDVVMRVWPQSAALYRGIGALPEPKDLLLTNVSYRRDTEAGLPVLTIRGVIANNSSTQIAVPPIEAILSDGNGRVVDRWNFSSGILQLAAGQKAEFTMRRIDPPASARHFQINFTHPHK